MKLKELKSNFQHGLDSLYQKEEIQSFFNWVAEAYLGYSRFEVSVKKEEEISEAIQLKVEEALHRLQNFEPIQYIIGETEFYGLKFKVAPATLIPRPETEELVQWIISDSKFKIQDSTILDIGTGTGCIAISIAKHLENAKVSALDVSNEALQVAEQNAQENNVGIDFFQTNILKADLLPEQYDCIISNPPYVRELEKEYMQPNVIKHEPESALYVSNEDPLLFYRAIARLAKNYLKPDGKLYFEINEYLSKEMQVLLTSEGFTEIELKKDMFDKFRMVRCSL